VEEKEELDFKAYTVAAFNPEEPSQGTEGGDHHIWLMDDFSTDGDKLRKIFMEAVGQLALRDNAKSDEPRKVNFIHYNVTNEADNQKWIAPWFKDFNESQVPDVVYRSDTRYQKLEFTMLNTGDEDKDLKTDGERMMKMIDELTKGRVDFASCKTIERYVMEEERIVMVFFGEEELLWNSGNYTHLTQMVSMDRSRHWTEEPIVFLQNDSKQCKIKAAGLDNGIHIVLFYKDSEEPDILSESNEKHLETMKDKSNLMYWIDVATIRVRKSWGARAFHALQMGKGQMIAYV
jgi:hypothetical protein